jgi:2,4-dienoyl-CoA reductase-like NADH-dependent reductase (Old Yellow Enzyme family)/thioredoxin reductase
MSDLFSAALLGPVELPNRFVFPPIKTAFGKPSGEVTERHLLFYGQIAREGPGLVTVEPVSVTEDGREHPKQLTIHLKESVSELRKVVEVIHQEGRKACLHVNHAGGAANPKVIGHAPRSPSVFTCPRTGATADALTVSEIEDIVRAFGAATRKAVEAGFDAVELQAGHGYLVDQFLNPTTNQRTDDYGVDRLMFARSVIRTVAEGGRDLALIIRISGEGMAPGRSTSPEDIDNVVNIARKEGFSAVHVGMGSTCFSPAWYFHHMALPEAPQERALARVKGNTDMPVIAAGRMGSLQRVRRMFEEGLADMIALGRPLIADPDLIQKWAGSNATPVQPCGYCLQGCLVHVADGTGIGCNFNPGVGRSQSPRAGTPRSVLVAGGGPAGLSAARYLADRGHKVTLVEKSKALGGNAVLAPLAPGKETMAEPVTAFASRVREKVQVLLGKEVDRPLIEKMKPDLLVWATGAKPREPAIPGMDRLHVMTCIDYFEGRREVEGKRVLVIGAGRNGLEAAEKLGAEGFDVVATKRTDTLGSYMEPISKKLCLTRIENMPNVTLMPRTTILEFTNGHVRVQTPDKEIELPSFDTVILCTGMLPQGEPFGETVAKGQEHEVVGDACEVKDIYSAVRAGYELAMKH